MPEYLVTLWYTEILDGKAYTRVKASNRDEARAKFFKEINEGNEDKMEWEYKVKGSDDLIYNYDEVDVTEIKVEDD
jgi:catalase